MKLKDRVAVVTGGSRGIGRAVCLRFGREGARVIVNYLSRADKAQEVVSLIQEAGGQAFAVQADVSDETQVQAMMDCAAQRYGGIDILVNNAGNDPRRAWTEISADDWDQLLGVNLKGQFLCARAAYAFLKASDRAKIINVTSVVYFLGFRDLLHYSASKGGIIGLTRGLARELGKDRINVNAIALGAIQTESELEEFPDQEALAATMAERQCLPDRISADDVTGTFVFLASTESDPITGQTLLVDGGWALH